MQLKLESLWLRLGHHQWKLSAAVVATICSMVYAPIFTGRVLFFRDLALWIYPARDFVKRTLASGHWPIWNPEVGIGFAISSDPLYGLLYPGNWLYLLGPTAVATTVVAFAHLLWGAMGMLRLARRLGLTPYAALLSSVAWALSGTTTSWWTAGVLLNAAAWVPWCAAGLIGLIAVPSISRRDVARAVWPLAMAVLLGEIFVAIMGVGFGVALGLLKSRFDVVPGEFRGSSHSNRPKTTSRKRALFVVFAILLGVMAGSATLVPALVGAGATPRGSRLSKEVAEVGSFHPWRIFEVMAPGIFGDPFDDYPGELVVGDPQLSNRPLTDSAYAGAAALSLALMAFGRRRSFAIGILSIAAAALLIALGRHTPLHGLIRTLILPLAFLRYPEKYLIVFAPAVAILVGLGAEQLLKDCRQHLRRAMVPAFVLLGVATTSGWLMPTAVLHHFRQGLIWGAAAFVLVPLVATLLRTRQVTCRCAVLFIVVLDLALAVTPLQRFAPTSVLQDEPVMAKQIREDYSQRHGLGVPRLFRSKQIEQLLSKRMPTRDAVTVELHSSQTLADNLSNVFGVASIRGYDAAVPSIYVDLVERGRYDVVRRQRLLSCEYVLAPVLPKWDDVAVKEKLLPLRQAFTLARLYRIPGVLNRAYFAPHADILDDKTAMQHVLSEPVLNAETVLLAPSKDVADSQKGANGTGECKLISIEQTRVEAKCLASSDGYAVFVEQFHPGWTAKVDGVNAPVLRANLVMRAVPIGTGNHTVVVEFHQRELAIGIFISFAALAVVIFLSVVT